MRRAITWDSGRMTQLATALETARRVGDQSFTVDLEGQGKHHFSINEAAETMRYLEEAFANNPPRKYPPNREGQEGQ